MRSRKAQMVFQFMENLPEVFWVFNPRDVELVYINPAYESIWGRPCSSVYRRPLSFLSAVHPEDQEKALAMVERQLRCEPSVEEFRVLHPDGTVRSVRDRSFPVRIGSEQAIRMVGIVEDITKSRRKGRQKRNVHRADTVEQLARSVAHDFNSVLTAIIGNGGLLLKDSALSTSARRRASAMLRAALLGRTINKELTDIGGHLLPQLIDLDLNEIISEHLDELECLLGTHIEVTTILAPGLVSIRANPEQMTRVLLNLSLNARDAMPSGGHLTIATCNAGESELPDENSPSSHPRCRYAVLTVADDGQGMDPTTQARMFKPFFTTKGNGVGTGLGLYIVKQIVDHCGGHIRVSSKVGLGATFDLYFPEA